MLVYWSWHARCGSTRGSNIDLFVQSCLFPVTLHSSEQHGRRRWQYRRQQWWHWRWWQQRHSRSRSWEYGSRQHGGWDTSHKSHHTARARVRSLHLCLEPNHRSVGLRVSEIATAGESRPEVLFNFMMSELFISRMFYFSHSLFACLHPLFLCLIPFLLFPCVSVGDNNRAQVLHSL